MPVAARSPNRQNPFQGKARLTDMFSTPLMVMAYTLESGLLPAVSSMTLRIQSMISKESPSER